VLVEEEAALRFRVVAEIECAETDDRTMVIQAFEGHQFSDQSLAQKEPLAPPLDLAAAPNPAHFARVGVLDLRQPFRIRPQGTNIRTCRWSLTKCFVRTDVIELLEEGIELQLLAAAVGRRCCTSLLFEVRCIRSSRPFCWGLPGSIRRGSIPRRIQRTDNFESLLTEFDENGVPLSERIESGNPNSRNTLSNTCQVRSSEFAASAWHPMTYRLNESAIVSG
jgi:hypothetical protein